MNVLTRHSKYSRHRFSAVWLLGWLSISCASLANLANADWPLERGDADGSGFANIDFSTQPDELWRFEAEDSGFEATPVVSDGKVFIGDFDGTFYAISLRDGNLIWKKSFKNSGFPSAAAVSNGKVFVGDFNGMLRCFDVANGELLWEYEARGEMYAGPNVVDGRVLVTTEAGEMLSIDAESGEKQWVFEIDAPLRCWPTVIDGQVLLAGCDSRLHAVELDSGRQVKSLELAGQTGSTPTRHGRRVYFGTATGLFYCIADMEEQWTFQDDRGQETFSAATDGRFVVYSSKGKRIYALDLEKGEPQWDATVRRPLESAPIIAGNSVLFGTKRGYLIALDLKTGDRLWAYEAGGDFLAAPAVSDGKLLVANEDGSLYCFEGKKTTGERSDPGDDSDTNND